LNTYRDGDFVRDDHGWVDLGKYGPTAALTYLDTFGADRKWGVALSGSFSQTINTRDRVQMNRPNVDNLVTTRARQLNDIDTRVRAGISGKLEYRLDETLRLGVSASFNYYTFAGDRSDWDITSTNGVADYSRLSRAAIEAGGAPRTSANAAAGIAPGFTDTYNELLHATIRNRTSSGRKLSQQSKFGTEARKKWNDTHLVVQASYNPSNSRQKSYLFEARRTGGVGIGVDTSRDPARPVYTQTYGATIGPGSDFNNYSGSNTRRILNDDYTFEDITNTRADLQHKFSRLALPVTFKTGADYRRQYRWYTVFAPNWNLVGADGVAGLNPATGRNDDNIGSFVNPNYRYSLFNNAMMQRDHLDYRLAEKLFQSNPGYWVPSSATTLVRGVARRISEDVRSGYAQATVALGKLNVLGGARFEHTEVEGTGSLSDPQAATQTTATVASSYRAWYPSIHLKYNLSSDLLLRASYSTSGARPAISALVPDTSVSYNTDGRGLGRVTRNNPGLKPQRAGTYDFSAEYYIEPAGVVSAGAFRKDITDFLYRITSIVGAGGNNGFDGRYEGFELTSTGNLGSARVEGVELNYSQQLRWLPRPFDGLSVFANYTRLRTAGSYAEGVAELADFVPTTYNIGGSFSYR
jgi:TonB-dependent receptor